MEVDQVTGLPVLSEREQKWRDNELASLVQLVEWLKDHPTIPIPTGLTGVQNIFADSKEAFAAMRRASGFNVKESVGDYIVFAQKFGTISLEINCEKKLTCERVKVGQRTLPAVPSKVVEAIPERVEEIFEWKCNDPILS